MSELVTAPPRERPIPDVYVVYTDERKGVTREPIFAIEIGFPESPESLKESIENIFKFAPLMKLAMTIDIKESPQYRNPLQKSRNAEMVHRAAQGVESPSSIAKDYPFVEETSDKYEPISRFGIPWVGTLSATAQLWKRGTDGDAVLTKDPIVSIPIRTYHQEVFDC